MIRDSFEFAGRSSTAFGLHVSSFPPIGRPEARVETLTIPGRAGTLTLTDGTDIYEPMSYSMDAWIEDRRRIPEVLAWLRGAGELRLACRPDGVYSARVDKEFTFEKVTANGAFRTLTITFEVQPFFLPDGPAVRLTNGQHVVNRYDITAQPVFEVRGSGDITLTVGEDIVRFYGVQDMVALDCSAMMQTAGSCDSIVLEGEEWPELQPGETVIGWSGSVTGVVLRPNWRCL